MHTVLPLLRFHPLRETRGWNRRRVSEGESLPHPPPPQQHRPKLFGVVSIRQSWKDFQLALLIGPREQFAKVARQRASSPLK